MAGRLPQAWLDELRDRADIVQVVSRYVQLNPKGGRYWGLCPFHGEKTPSFSVNPQRQMYYCFGCHAGGSAITFVMEMEHLDFMEAVKLLAEQVHMEVPELTHSREDAESKSRKERLYEANRQCARFFHAQLWKKESAQILEYLHGRELSDSTIRIFGLGATPPQSDGATRAMRELGFTDDELVSAGISVRREGRVYDMFRQRAIFPIIDAQGRVLGFGGRALGDVKPKYLNTGDTPIFNKRLGVFAANLLKKQRGLKRVILTEGYMDVVTLHQFGYSSAVGVLGTAFTPEQVKRISGFTSHVELLFDGDGPGRKAALRACEMLLTRGLSCKVVLFPEGEDIDSLLRTQGTEIFEDLRRNAPEGMAFCVRCLRDMAPREAVDWAREFLRQVELPELVSRFASTLSTGLGLAESELRERIIESRGARALPRNAGGQETQPPVRTNPRDREIMTFAVRYPSSLPRLRELGAHLVLSAAWARDLWQKLEEYPVDEVVQHLDPREKRFWIRCRTGDVPPLDNEEGEFGAIRTMLDTLHLTAQSASVSAALRQGAGAGNFEADLEYLRALQETLERTHGEQH